CSQPNTLSKQTAVHQKPNGITKKSWNHQVRPTSRSACRSVHRLVTSALTSSFLTSLSIPLSIVLRIDSREPPVKKSPIFPTPLKSQPAAVHSQFILISH